MTPETEDLSPEAALGAGLAVILLGSVTLNLLAAHGLVASANIGELMDAALLQLESSCGLPGPRGAAAQIARAHILNIYRDIETLPPMSAWRKVQKGARTDLRECGRGPPP
jgi:hypothetical protein